MNVSENENTGVPEADGANDLQGDQPELEQDQQIDQVSDQDQDDQDEQQKLDLQVAVESNGACERHITVTVSREDIDRYIEKEFDELVPQAEVPGFRPGKAPRKLVVSRYKKYVLDQVKGKLLMDSMTQVNEDESLAAISEPDLDYDAVKLPDDGPMVYEFDLEVRPEFDTPNWKGMTLNKPVREITDADVDAYQRQVLRRWAKLVKTDEPAQMGDIVTLQIVFRLDGRELSKVEDADLVLKEKLSLHDTELENFGELLVGAKPGDRKTTVVTISDEAEAEEVRGKEVEAEFHVLAVKRLQFPKLTAKFLDEIGEFFDENDFREELREELERQVEYRSQQSLRKQIVEILTAGAQWELPRRLLQRQAHREMQRARLELESAGFSPELIKAYENRLRQNSLAATERALKEHFIFEQIAEDEKIEPSEADYEAEIRRLAEQNGVPARRIRAQLEKGGQMDALRNQIVERKVVELITSHALVTEQPVEIPADDTTVLSHAASGVKEKAEIPEAKHGEEGEQAVPGQPKPRG